MHNLQVSLVQALLTRNIQNDLNQLKNFDMTLTQAITPDQRQFMQTNWRALSPFLQTDEGKIALQTFISDMMAFARGPAPAPLEPPAAPAAPPAV